MQAKKRTTSGEAKRTGDQIRMDWTGYEFERFRRGIDVEYEPGRTDPQTDVTHDDPTLTGEIALARIKEFPDYYERLEKMEANAEREWTERRKQKSTLIRGREARAN